MASNAMENGEMINPMNITTNSWWRGILGFTKDNELMAGVPDVTDYYTAHIFDENDSDTEKIRLKFLQLTLRQLVLQELLFNKGQSDCL